MTTTTPSPTDVAATRPGRARRVARSLAVLAVFLVVGTYLVSRVVGIDPVEAAINGRIWCPGDDASMRSHSRSSGAAVRTNGDSLVCRRDGEVVREVGVARVLLTDLAVSAGVTLIVMSAGIGSLVAVGRLRGRPALVRGRARPG